MVHEQWRRKFFSEGWLTGSIESQVAGLCLGGSPPDAEAISAAQSSPKSTFNYNLKHSTKIPTHLVVGI